VTAGVLLLLPEEEEPQEAVMTVTLEGM